MSGQRCHVSYCYREDPLEALEVDAHESVQKCSRCTLVKTGERVRRSLATAFHGQEPNEVVHVDFSYVEEADTPDLKYLLLLGKDLRSYTWLMTSSSPNNKSAVQPLSKWAKALGSVNLIVSDGVPRFESAVIEVMKYRSFISPHFTAAHRLSANGTLERV